MDAQSGKSVLTYVPVSDIDYGTLSCRATNLAGQQSSPCIYTLLPATRPDPPSNCSVYNLTDDSLDLTCLAGNLIKVIFFCIYFCFFYSKDPFFYIIKRKRNTTIIILYRVRLYEIVLTYSGYLVECKEASND